MISRGTDGASKPSGGAENANVLTQFPDSVAAARKCLNAGGAPPAYLATYPADADEHFVAVHTAFERWTADSTYNRDLGHSGPWIENHWIEHFSKAYQVRRASGGALKDIFGPYVPLLVPWNDLWMNENPADHSYPDGFVDAVLSALRPDVLYITVSQNPGGLAALDEHFSMDKVSNVLVLSAGGYGHVPIPLLLDEQQLNNRKPLRNRKYFANSLGTLEGRGLVRSRVKQHLEAFAAKANVSVLIGRRDDWRGVMADSRFSICTRGNGRTSFHLAETINMGLVPVYVWGSYNADDDDQEWLPYRDSARNYIYSVPQRRLPALLEQLGKMTDEEIEARQARVAGAAHSYTYAGVVEQVGAFLLGGEIRSMLRCEERGLPATTGLGTTKVASKRRESKVDPSTAPTLCLHMATEHGVTPGVTWGSLPASQRSQWKELDCDNMIQGRGSVVAAMRRPAFVISLKGPEGAERRAHFTAEAKREGLNFSFVDAITPADLPPCSEMATAASPFQQQRLGPQQREGQKMSPYEYSLSAGHKAIWDSLLVSDMPAALIFEDDVVLAPGFVEKASALQTPPLEAFDVLKLEHCGTESQLAAASDVPRLQERSSSCTAGYVVTRRGARKLSRANTPIWACADCIMDPNFLAIRDTTDFRQFVAVPKLAQQPDHPTRSDDAKRQGDASAKAWRVGLKFASMDHPFEAKCDPT